jgi:hypothetical protein
VEAVDDLADHLETGLRVVVEVDLDSLASPGIEASFPQPVETLVHVAPERAVDEQRRRRHVRARLAAQHRRQRVARTGFDRRRTHEGHVLESGPRRQVNCRGAIAGAIRLSYSRRRCDMTPREIVRAQIEHREAERVPHTLAFEEVVGERLDAHFEAAAATSWSRPSPCARRHRRRMPSPSSRSS